MAIKVSQAFERTSSNPVDVTLTLTKAQMLAVNDNLMPNRYFTICQDDGYIYLYDKTATPSATTGKFTKFEGGSGVPVGGTTGQALVKNSSTDGDVKWSTINSIPTGGTTGQALVKKSNTDKDVQWSTINSIPTGGTTGQVLAKKSNTDRDVEWKNDIPGHTIKNSTATTLTQRTNLQLKGVSITDDSTNNATVVETLGLNSDDWNDIIDSSEINNGYIQSGLNYSTNEQVVGKWINGKPVYQKTLVYASITKKSTTPLLTDIDTIINFSHVHSRSGTLECMDSFYVSSSDYLFIIPSIKNGNFYIYYDIDTNHTITDWKITIQYTKTTD